jgi:hypothetical protein
MIESVTVQVDGDPPIDANLTRIPNRQISLFSFQASAQVTGGQDPGSSYCYGNRDQRPKRLREKRPGDLYGINYPSR